MKNQSLAPSAAGDTNKSFNLSESSAADLHNQSLGDVKVSTWWCLAVLHLLGQISATSCFHCVHRLISDVLRDVRRHSGGLLNANSCEPRRQDWTTESEAAARQLHSQNLVL